MAIETWIGEYSQVVAWLLLCSGLLAKNWPGNEKNP
jgi:hypothetical protein